MMNPKIFYFALLSVMLTCSTSLATSDYEDLTLGAESYWNGADGSGGFLSGDNWFTNYYDDTYGPYWEGFAYSNKTDVTATGMAGQYTAYSNGGEGVNCSDNYAVSYVGFYGLPQTYNGYLTGNYAQTLTGVYLTNNAYAYHSMLNGDAFAKKFGGDNGTDPDWFLLTAFGLDENYERNGSSVEFYLADYRFADSQEDYIIDDWTWVDLTGLGEVYGVEFELASSDTGEWGMNTPAYFAMDDFNGAPPADEVDLEDLPLSPESYWNGADGSGGFTSASVAFNNYYDDTYGPYWEGFAYSNMSDVLTTGMAGQFNAIAGGGAKSSSTYSVGYVGFYGVIPTASLPAQQEVQGVYITNNNYAYHAMLNGDAFAKKFGGDNGTDPDWFLLTITGKDACGDTTGSVEFYLADYRFADSADDYIVDEWAWVDLSGLGEVSSLVFSLSSSDTGEWGMNTPAYFCLDSLNSADGMPPEITAVTTNQGSCGSSIPLENGACVSREDANIIWASQDPGYQGDSQGWLSRMGVAHTSFSYKLTTDTVWQTESETVLLGNPGFLGRWSWIYPLDLIGSDGDYDIRLSAEDSAGNRSEVTYQISVDTTDTDEDDIPDCMDNCVEVCNPLQMDADHDGLGDLCDPEPNCGGGCQPACEEPCPAP